MKSLIIYHSTYRNNTEKLARIFADKIHADLYSLEDSQKVIIENYDLIGLGSGVYRESLSPKLLKYAGSINLRDKDVFVFSTSGVGMKFYNNKLITLIESKGGRVKGSFACRGSFASSEFSKIRIFGLLSKLAVGHPNDKDICKAEKFINRLVGEGNTN